MYASASIITCMHMHNKVACCMCPTKIFLGWINPIGLLIAFSRWICESSPELYPCGNPMGIARPNEFQATWSGCPGAFPCRLLSEISPPMEISPSTVRLLAPNQLVPSRSIPPRSDLGFVGLRRHGSPAAAVDGDPPSSSGGPGHRRPPPSQWGRASSCSDLTTTTCLRPHPYAAVLGIEVALIPTI